MAKVKVFGNRQTDTHRQKGTQTDRTKLDFHELHLSEIEGWGEGVMRVFPKKNFCGKDAKLCYSGLIWTNLDEKLGLKDTVFI